MVTQGAFNKLFRAGLRKDFRDEYQRHETAYSQYLNMGTMTGPEIFATTIAGLNRLVERGDGESVTYEDPKMGPKVVGVDKEFALGFIITRRTVEDDLYGKANQASKWLAYACHMTYEYRAAALLDDMFSGSVFKGIDNLAMFSTAHTTLNSSSGTVTWANKPTTPIGFGMTGIRALLDLSQLVKDQNGNPMVTNLDTIVYNPTNMGKAAQIFRGNNLEPFTTDNQDSDVKIRLPRMKEIVKRYTTDTTSFMMVDSKLNDAHFLIRRAVEFDDTFDFDTDAAKYKATTRFMVWFVDPRGWFGSSPS